MTNLIEKYVPKYAQDLVLELDKDIDGYDLVLVDGYYFTDTETTMRIELTVADLKKAFKFIAKIEEEETVEAVETVETTPAVDAVETTEETVETVTAVGTVEPAEAEFFVEMIHDDEFMGSFAISEISDLEDIAQYHASVYVAGDEIVYQVYMSGMGVHIGDVTYSFDGKKATKLS